MLSYFRSLCRAGFFTRVFRVSGSVESTYAEQLKKKNNLKKKQKERKETKKRLLLSVWLLRRLHLRGSKHIKG